MSDANFFLRDAHNGTSGASAHHTFDVFTVRFNRNTTNLERALRARCLRETNRMKQPYPFQTLPDHLRRGLDLVFVGINPGLFSVERGHYFARKTSRFWPAFSKSKLSDPMRRALGVERLLPEHDSELLRFGIGITDVIKRPSANASELKPAEFAQWVPHLIEKLRRYAPRVACFHGLTAFRPFLRIALQSERKPALGAQPEVIGSTRLFVAPNPSPANAHFTPKDQAEWYDRLAEYLGSK